jgi:hypothetical protein
MARPNQQAVRLFAEQPVVPAGKVSLEAAHRLHAGLAFGFLAREVGTRFGVQAAACDRYDVQRAVELTIASTVGTV